MEQAVRFDRHRQARFTGECLETDRHRQGRFDVPRVRTARRLKRAPVREDPVRTAKQLSLTQSRFGEGEGPGWWGERRRHREAALKGQRGERSAPVTAVRHRAPHVAESRPKLLTKEIAGKLPELYATEGIPESEKVLVVKFFTPDSNWTWYGVEFDGKDRFFGYVEGHEREWGYFSLKELASVRGPMGLKVERDLYWKPTKFKDLHERR